MKNFDDDLGDVLSDGSNDSFFDDPKPLTKRASLTKIPNKKTISDLFGLQDDKPKEKSQSKQSDWLRLDEKPVVAEPPKSATGTSSKLTKKISFENDDDILGSLSLGKSTENIPDTPKASETSSRKQEPVKKSALMESLFGPPKQQTTELSSSLDDILKESKISKQKASSSARSTDNLPTTPTETRRSRHISSSSGVTDHLGLFSTPKKKEETSIKISRPNGGEGDAKTTNIEILHNSMTKDLKTKSASNIKDLPEWLGGGSPLKAYKSDSIINKIEKKDQLNDMEAKENKVEEETNKTNVTDAPMLDTLLTQHKLATSHIEYQNTSIALQQQESQILMALQLKKYEENLLEMQKKQQNILLQQERQFNSLLERQFAKQQIMENNMHMQQERINNHIQLLISQPPIAANSIETEEREERVQLKKHETNENSRLYEGMIETLKERQNEEIFLLNESYKKQISVLENSMEAVENRLKDELKSLSDKFQSSQDNMKKDHEAEIDKYKEKINELSNFHVNEIKLIRENNNRIVEEIKHEYMMMVENMKEVKQTESSLLANASVYAQKLDTNLEVLDASRRMLNNMQEKVQQDYNVVSIAREESLKAKEEEIKLMRNTLEKCREAAETERAELMTLVRTLEMKLVEQTQNGKEERWALQQASAILAARSAAFDREMEFARTSLEREKEQLKTLKESILADQEKVMLQLTEEKLYVSAEKARLETTAKLSQNYDKQKAQAEIEAAISVARQATEAADQERKTLHKQRSEVEILKRNLLDRERKLELRNDELQEMLSKADEKMTEGERAISEAKKLEAKCNARLKEIQGQLMSLGNRERKLAEEKISLSKERLSLHNSLRQVKKCSLCAADDLLPEGSVFGDDNVEQDFLPRMYPVTDPDLVRLRNDISE